MKGVTVLNNIMEVDLTEPALIEASAGTGKTYTLEELYIRALRESDELTVENILVVTFTKAAAAELRERLQRKLGEVRKDARKKGSEDFKKWNDAILSFDLAPVLTIHGFCEKVLSEFAFEGGLPFEVELNDTDTDPVSREMVFDFWRRKMYSKIIPEALLREEGDFGNEDIEGLTIKSLSKPLAKIEKKETVPIEELIEIAEKLREEFSKYNVPRDLGIRSNSTNQIKDFYALKELFKEEVWNGLDSNIKIARIVSVSKKLSDSSAEKLQEIVSSLTTIRSNHTSLKECMMFEVCEELAGAKSDGISAVTRRRRKEGVRGFDDMVNDVRIMLETNEEAREALQERYRMGMIDEFQDTDPVQWRIFELLFAQRTDARRIILVGDPKQAIYAFRGGDIGTYMRAKNDVSEKYSGKIYSLPRNYRSEPAQVTAVNSVFYSQGEPGAFNVEGMQGSIEYSNIEDKTRDQNATDLEVEILQSMEERFPEDPSEKEAPGLVVRDVSQERKADDRRWAIGQDLVNEIRNLTNPDKWQILTYAKSADGKWEYEGKRAVRMKDIFVLTYNRSDMRRYYDRLSDAGIPCTMRADESVLGEVEAGWMQCLLEVALSAGRRGLAELLATPLFSKSIAEIYDEVVSDTGSQVAEIIRRATVEWKKFGFQSFLSQIVRECKIKEKLLKEQAGERHWTNFAQIAEILSDTEKSKHLSPDGLRDWLDDAVDSRKKSDEYTFRLESDEEAVTAMTIHKSKGLQAPIVFVAGINPSKKSSTEPVKTYYDDKGNSVLTINPEEHSERIRAEEIAEAIRLFYVAITRAENRTYYYMGKEDVKSEILSHLFKVSSTLEKGGPGVAIEDVVKDLDFSTVYRESEKEYNLIKPSVEISKITPWTMTSFSSLKDAIETFEFLEEADVTGKDFEYPAEDEPEDRPEESDDLETEGQIFPLRYIMPGGTVFGNYVHEIFEKCPFDAGKNEIREFAQKGLKDWDLEQTHGMPEYVKAITGMVYDTLTAAIPDACGRVFTLASIEADKRCIELEFHFPIEQARLSDLLQLLKSWGGIYAWESGKMRHLPVDINGMMKGFMDLVFEHEGRFYIVDWKTNVLDKSPSSFEIDCEDPLASRIAEEIATAMYPLQWTIYTLALHRHLKNTLPGYDYEKHFGGVRYLFVRGISEEHPGAGIWVQPPLPVEAIEELDSFFKR